MRTDTLTVLVCQPMSTFTFFYLYTATNVLLMYFSLCLSFVVYERRLSTHDCFPLSPRSQGCLHIIYCAAIEFQFVDFFMGTAKTNWAHVES